MVPVHRMVKVFCKTVTKTWLLLGGDALGGKIAKAIVKGDISALPKFCKKFDVNTKVKFEILLRQKVGK